MRSFRSADSDKSLSFLRFSDSETLRGGYDDYLVGVGGDLSAVAELGAGANPVIGGDEWKRVGRRVAIDISNTELSKSDADLEKRTADLCQPLGDELASSFDLVFSKMLCEHIEDPLAFHGNCFKLLRPGGLSVHLHPTLFAFPFLINYMIPEAFGSKILSILQPGARLNDGNLGKFPAKYRWCEGGSRRQVDRYRSVGFDIVEINSGFGHSYYTRFPRVDRLERAKSDALLRRPVIALSAFARVTLRKPQS